jgi:hypothetical protein
VVLKLNDWQEELQAYIAADTEYTVGTDFFAGQVFEVDDITTTPSMTMYEEDSEVLFGGRMDIQTRVVRFVFRDNTAHNALNRANDFLVWLRNKQVISTDTYTTRLHRFFQMPSALAPGDSGIYPSEIIVSFIVTS